MVFSLFVIQVRSKEPRTSIEKRWERRKEVSEDMINKRSVGEAILLPWESAGFVRPPRVRSIQKRIRPYRFGRVLFIAVSTAFLAMNPTAHGADIVISEFMARNDAFLADEDGEFQDWIELHNVSGSAIDLNGWYLTDDDEELAQWRIPAVSIDPGAYLLIFASGKDRRDPAEELHTNFKLDADGEYLALVMLDGATVLNEYSPIYPRQHTDISYGYAADGVTLAYFDTPTPGSANNAGFPGFVEDTKFNPDRGFYDAPFTATITCDTPGAVIRYTTNGSPPT